MCTFTLLLIATFGFSFTRRIMYTTAVPQKLNIKLFTDGSNEDMCSKVCVARLLLGYSALC